MPITRKRNTILEAIVQFRRLHPNLNLAQIEAFLYICENPDASEAALSALCGFSPPRISRIVRSLASPESDGALPPYYGLLEIGQDLLDGRQKTIRLSTSGEILRDRLDDVIKAAVRISTEKIPPQMRPHPAAGSRV